MCSYNVLETELPKNDYFSAHVLCIYLYLYLCICVCVHACVRTCTHTKTIYLFILYRTARIKMYSTICVRHFTFSNKIKTMKLFSPVNIFISILLTTPFGNCAAFLCGRFQELPHCYREATSRSLFTE